MINICSSKHPRQIISFSNNKAPKQIGLLIMDVQLLPLEMTSPSLTVPEILKHWFYSVYDRIKPTHSPLQVEGLINR
jgi:hypothetical protein